MLAISRALMAAPAILLDEPSLGLSPKLTRRSSRSWCASTASAAPRINNGMPVEQNASARRLQRMDYGYVLENQAIVMENSATRGRRHPEFYLDGGRTCAASGGGKEENMAMRTT